MFTSKSTLLALATILFAFVIIGTTNYFPADIVSYTETINQDSVPTNTRFVPAINKTDISILETSNSVKLKQTDSKMEDKRSLQNKVRFSSESKMSGSQNRFKTVNLNSIRSVQKNTARVENLQIGTQSNILNSKPAITIQSTPKGEGTIQKMKKPSSVHRVITTSTKTSNND